MAECEISAARGTGPGGQKRNKTSTAVRVVHVPTGVAVSCDETRSQARNRKLALARLVPQIAVSVREAAAPADDDLSAALRRPDSRAEGFWLQAAQVLDVLDEEGGGLGATARALGVSTAQLSRFLRASDALLRAANELRARHGKSAMR